MTQPGENRHRVEPRPALHVRILIEREDEDGVEKQTHGTVDTLNRLVRVEP